MVAGREMVNFQACLCEKSTDLNGCLNGFGVSLSITNSETKKDCLSLLVTYNIKKRSFERRVSWRLKKSERMGLECMAVVI